MIVMKRLAKFVKPQSVHTTLSLAMAHKWSIYQIDVKNAFLHNDLRETIYMHQTPSFVDRRTPHYVCRLRKDLKETSKYMVLAICDLFFYIRVHHYKK